MELDFKKKIIIGGFIAVILLIFGYLYYDYINSSSNTIYIESGSEEEQNKSGIAKNLILNEKDTKEDNIIIIHIAGAVKNPRNCENKRRFKVI